MSETPHDALFRATFSSAEHAAPVLRSLLPPALAAAIDFTTLTLEPGSFVDKNLEDRRSDLLYTARMGSRRVYLYLLFEHQSTADPLMVLRLLEYMIFIWHMFLRNNPGARTLPAIIPIVLHHSQRGWTVPRRFAELLDVPADLWPVVAPLVPQFEILLDDISNAEDQALLARSMTTMGRIVLFLMRHAHDPDVLARMEKATSLLRKLSREPGGEDAICAIQQYLRSVTRNRTEVDMAMRKVFTRDDYDSIIDPLGFEHRKGREEGLAEGESRGLAKGLAEGKREGLVEGQLQFLERLLRRRFGRLPQRALDRLGAATPDALQAIADRLLTAATLDDALGTASKAAPRPRKQTPRGIPRPQH